MALVSAITFSGAMGLAAGDADAQTPPMQAAPAQASVSPASNFPTISAIRVSGDAQQTRMIVDLNKRIGVRAFTLADPYRVVIDIPQVVFNLPAQPENPSRGLVKAYRYGVVVAGGSRIVIDLAGPARIEKAQVLDAANEQPARLVLDLAATDRTAFLRAIAIANAPPADVTGAAKAIETKAVETKTAEIKGAPSKDAPDTADSRPLVVIDPGHGGIDNGTRAGSGEDEKTIVLEFAIQLRDFLARGGKYRLVMTRTDDTFIPLGERVKIARDHKAALFISIHADALPRGEGDAKGATIYTLSDKASDAVAARLAETENKADAIAGINLGEEKAEVADILIDLVQRETRTFSGRFAGMLERDLRRAARLNKKPVRSAGFKVLKAPDVPSVLIELGYVSNKDDLKLMLSDKWRGQTVEAMARSVDAFFGHRTLGAAN